MRPLLLAVLLFSLSAPATALTITSAALGGDKGCSDLTCSSVTSIFLSASGSGGGTIALVGNTLSFSIDAGDAIFGSITGTPTFSFENLNYTGTATVSTIGSSSVVLSGAATITGFVNGMMTPLNTNAITVGGTCVDGGASCGLVFSLVAPDGLSYFHTVNLSAVPEPTLGALLGLAGLAGLARRRTA